MDIVKEFFAGIRAGLHEFAGLMRETADSVYDAGFSIGIVITPAVAVLAVVVLVV